MVLQMVEAEDQYGATRGRVKALNGPLRSVVIHPAIALAKTTCLVCVYFKALSLPDWHDATPPPEGKYEA